MTASWCWRTPGCPSKAAARCAWPASLRARWAKWPMVKLSSRPTMSPMTDKPGPHPLVPHSPALPARDLGDRSCAPDHDPCALRGSLPHQAGARADAGGSSLGLERAVCLCRHRCGLRRHPASQVHSLGSASHSPSSASYRPTSDAADGAHAGACTFSVGLAPLPRIRVST